MPDESRKRKAPADDHSHAGKRSKGRRQWRSLPARQGGGSIEPGDAGIWATCNMGREAKAVGELKDMFEETKAPIEPVEFVRRICEGAMASSERKTGRFVKRLTPMTLMGKAQQKGLEEVAAQVLAPHFHAEGSAGKKFAIRPNIRNNKDLTRDQVIKTVAAAVGPGHSVDLKDYDLLILVDVYKGLCGMSVVGKDFERLKRYNLSEIYEPSPKEQPN
ncbi:putative thump domain-containing protein [Lasiodiplodia theobromae]|nr:putative thump domain-containing protein [Lasiodiplodia theobromae]